MSHRREPEIQGTDIRLIVEGEWMAAASQGAATGGFDILELHRGRQKDLSFLPSVADHVRSLWINCETYSAAGLEKLNHLERLTLGFPLPKPFDFRWLPSLRQLRIEAWKPWYAETLFAHPRLESLQIEGYDATDCSGPAALRALSSLCLAKGRLQTLAPLGKCGAIRTLRLSHLKLLANIDELHRLQNLENLSLGEGLPAIVDRNPVFGRDNLHSLAIVGTRAEVRDTRWLRACRKLRDPRLQSGLQEWHWPDLLASPDLRKLAVVFGAPMLETDEQIRQHVSAAGHRVMDLVHFGTRKRPALLLELNR